MDAFRDYPTPREANLCTMLVCICPTVEIDEDISSEVYIPVVTITTSRNFKSKYILPCPLREDEVIQIIQHERSCRQ